MADRPYTVLSVGMSIDGYIDSAGEDRLLLSNAADLDRVDEVRAWSDAIMVGASTVRNDDPRLLVRGADRRRGRLAEGRTPSPAKVTVTAGGRLDPAARFFADDGAEKLVFCARGAVRRVRDRVGVGVVRAGRRRVRGHAPDRRDAARPRRPPADGRGRGHPAHPVPHRRPRRRAAPGRRTALRRGRPGPPGGR